MADEIEESDAWHEQLLPTKRVAVLVSGDWESSLKDALSNISLHIPLLEHSFVLLPWEWTLPSDSVSRCSRSI
jgi:hypothetical protein